MRQIIFDLETTGFRFDEGHRIVEIGGVEMVRGAVTGRSFHTYVNPERDMPDGAFQVHGLSEKFLRDFPVFADPRVGKAFADFIDDAELVAHNGISFDLPFLNAELKAAGLGVLGNPIIDTLHLARRKFPGSPASLDALCTRFGVDTKERERDGHGALLDSRLLAEVYIELTGGLQAGLDLANAEGQARAARSGRRPARKRPAPLPDLVTEDEARAHAEFVAAELGPDAVWSGLAKA
jgi:DNA polymerase-3 subunit epsilon